MRDVTVIGAGPAGLSAAMTLRSRSKSVLLVSGAAEASPLARAEKIENYPGLPSVSGRALLERMTAQARELGAELLEAKAQSVLQSGETFFVSAGQEIIESRALILAVGARRFQPLPGETELLGRGVSYCATCDGMLYRGKAVAVLGFASDAEKEADFLRSIGCRVTYFDAAASRKAHILGTARAEAVELRGERLAFDGVFVLRDTAAPETLLPSLALRDKSILTEKDGRTSIPGVFAAGDCTGAPYQIAKAVGEGNLAALSAAAFLEEQAKGTKEVTL